VAAFKRPSPLTSHPPSCHAFSHFRNHCCDDKVWFERRSDVKALTLSTWLADLEETHRLLLLEGDQSEPGPAAAVTSWTLR